MKPNIGHLVAAIVVTALLGIGHAVADDRNYIFAEKQKTVCSEGGQRQMNECMAKEYGKVDQEMNAVYRTLVNALEDPNGIIKAQRAWIRFRDAECSDDVMQLGKDGSLYPYAHYSCLIEHTLQRTRYLRWHLSQDCNGCPPRK